MTLVCQLWICVLCYRDYSIRRRTDTPSTRSGSNGLRRALTNFDLPFLARMLAFTMFEILIVVASVVTIFAPLQGVTEVLLATPPFAVFLTFATSQDIFAVWFPCISRNRCASFARIRESQDLLREDKFSSLRSRPSIRYSIEKGPGSHVGMDIEKGIVAPIPAYLSPQRSWQTVAPNTNTALTAPEFGGSGTVVHTTNSRADLEASLDLIRGLEAQHHHPRPRSPAAGPGRQETNRF